MTIKNITFGNAIAKKKYTIPNFEIQDIFKLMKEMNISKRHFKLLVYSSLNS